MLTDFRYALKLLLKEKGFTAAALVTFALCIGANTAIFSVVNSVLLRPLPFPQSERIVRMYNSYPEAGAPRVSTGVPDYFDRVEGTTAFEAITLYRQRGLTVGERGSPERVQSLAVTPSFFRVVGVSPQYGRGFTEEEGQEGNQRKVILTHGFWQERFGGKQVLGQDLRIDGVAHAIVGVMPRDFLFEDRELRLFVPLTFTAEQRSVESRHSNNHEMLARVKPGVTLQQAQGQIDRVNQLNLERFPQFREITIAAGFHTVVTGYRDDLVRDIDSTLYLLQGGVLLVLLIGCVNLANLLLVRSTRRQRELATRAALGADRGRLTAQLLTESMTLSVLGGAAGVLLGYLAVRSFGAFAADSLPRGAELAMDGSVFALAALTTIVSGALFAAIPIARIRRANLSAVFREEGRSGTSSRSAVALRSGLVVAQTSLAFALLIAAGLMIVSFVRTLAVETGFRKENVLTASVALPYSRYETNEARAGAVEQLLVRIRAIPGVTDAAAADVIPFLGDIDSGVFTPEGYVAPPGESPYAPAQSQVSNRYFETMGVPVLRGRSFNQRDTQTSEPVMIIDEWLAHRYWPGQDPVGKRAFYGLKGIGQDEGIVTRTIVGMVKNVRMAGVSGNQPDGHSYIPIAQEFVAQTFLALHTSVEPHSIAGALRTAVSAVDPDLPIYAQHTMEERMSDSLATDRMRLILLVAFAAIALFLAAIGIYGVLAYTVAMRTGELGVRIALGASSAGVFRLVLGQGLRLAGIGLAIGLVLSLLLANTLRAMLFQVQPHEPIVFAGVIVILGVIAAAACVIPARRAMRVDPIVAFRG